MKPTKRQFIWSCIFRGEDLKKKKQSETRIAKKNNQKQELPVVAMFFNGSDEMCNL
jgi:hypothetical protein